MSLTPPAVTDWVMDSGASNHMTPDAGNISLFRPPHFTCPVVLHPLLLEMVPLFL